MDNTPHGREIKACVSPSAPSLDPLYNTATLLINMSALSTDEV